MPRQWKLLKELLYVQAFDADAVKEAISDGEKAIVDLQNMVMLSMVVADKSDKKIEKETKALFESYLEARRRLELRLEFLENG